MKSKKLIFLALALILPVAIFIFLKIFGRNEFHVPVMHAEGKIEAPEHCDYDYSAPYRIADSVAVSLGLNSADSVHVLYFDPSASTAMNRVKVEFPASVAIVGPDSFRGWDARLLRECVLLMEPPASVALVDHQHRIRGYYDGSDRDEVDRLIVEVKIILKQY